MEKGGQVETGQALYEWDPYSNVILTDRPGKIKFIDIIEGVTMREEFDETTGMSARGIVEQRDRSLSPQIEIESEQHGTRSYIIPVGARLLVDDGEKSSPGRFW